MPTVMTVNGPIDDTELGHILPHEHVFINLLAEYRANGLLNDFHRMAHEVSLFREAGGGTIVDLTAAELTRGAAPDPQGRYRGLPDRTGDDQSSRTSANVRELRELSQLTGVHIVIGTGHYRDPYLDRALFDQTSIDELAERIAHDITEGVRDTGIRAGIIGEIGADRWYVSAAEERSFRAAARANLRTGAPITTHAARWPVGIDQLEILTAEGVDPAHVIIGHCDGVNIPEYHRDIAKRGAYVQFDLIRGTDEWSTSSRVNLILGMVRDGFGDRILLSHDVCTVSHLRTAGGCGYTYICGEFTDRLVAKGLDRAEVEQIIIHNPRRALTSA